MKNKLETLSVGELITILQEYGNTYGDEFPVMFGKVSYGHMWQSSEATELTNDRDCIAVGVVCRKDPQDGWETDITNNTGRYLNGEKIKALIIGETGN